MKALEFRWALAYLLPTPLIIPHKVSRVHSGGLKQNAVGGVFSSCPLPTLCGFLIIIQGSSGLPVSPRVTCDCCVHVVLTPPLSIGFQG
jgi:hypothetical protein